MVKKHNTGRILVLSALAVCVCFAMLLGTTFAWFTDTAEVKVNSIQTGNFEIDIVDPENNNASLQDQVLSFVVANNGTYSETGTYWEPGATFVTQPFKIANKGNYDLKYSINVFANAPANADGVSLFTEVATGVPAVSFRLCTVNGSNYVDVTGENGVKMISAIGESNATAEINLLANRSTNDPVGNPSLSEEYVIVVHMAETANNDYQNLKIDSIALSVVASQLTSEYDSNGNQYDANAEIPAFVNPWDQQTTNP